MAYIWNNVPAVGQKIIYGVMEEISSLSTYIINTHCPSNNSSVESGKNSSVYTKCTQCKDLNHTSKKFYKSHRSSHKSRY